MKRIAFLTLALLGLPALADLPYAPVLNVTPPTTTEAGQAFDYATDGDRVSFYCDGDTEPTFEVFAPAEDYVSVFGDFTPGNHDCYATVWDIALAESDPSNTVNFNVAQDRPAPPVLSVD